MPELSLGFTPKLKFPGKIDSMCGEQILNPAQTNTRNKFYLLGRNG
jgi:hypothetical protein